MKISIVLDDQAVQAAFSRLLKSGHDSQPLMASVGEILLNSTRARFADEEDPDGNPWEPLKASTRARKTKNPDRILTASGLLGGSSINTRAGRRQVEIGSSRLYAATHQFGAEKGQFGRGNYKTKKGSFPIPWGDIPARPFLGLSAQDKEDIEATISDYLLSAWHE